MEMDVKGVGGCWRQRQARKGGGPTCSSAKPTGITIMLASGEWALIIELTRKLRNGKIKMRQSV